MAPKPLVLAVVGAPHGVRGEVRVKSFAADPMALGRLWRALSRTMAARFEIERLRPAKEVLIAKFRGVDDRNAAEALNGVELGVERSALPAPEEDEFYHADLIGLEAFDPAGNTARPRRRRAELRRRRHPGDRAAEAALAARAVHQGERA